jgi:hypothetical protein
LKIERTSPQPVPRVFITNTYWKQNPFETISAPITLVPPKAQNPASDQYLNQLTAIPSLENPNTALVCYSDWNPAMNGTDVKCFRFNMLTGRRISPISKAIGARRNTTYYGLSGAAISGSNDSAGNF